jgi:uncharacterized protein YjbJ (UPF0337 family)
MNKVQVKGIIDEVAGTAKHKAGELTDNPKLKVEGLVQQVKGKTESAWGKTIDSVHNAIDNTEVHLDANVKLNSNKSTPNCECKKSK